MSNRILAINPGSTSTKIAVYDDEKEIFSKSIDHPVEELNKFAELIDQFDYRKDIIEKSLEGADIDSHTLSAVVGRGGIIRNLATGGYIVNEKMRNELANNPVFIHASNLGGLIADSFAKPLGIPAYIYDAVTSNELLPVSKVTGFKEVERESFCHVLNSRAMSMKLARSKGKKYEDMNYVVAHMGGGVSISAHHHGRIIDSVSDDAGPFSPDRSGSLNLFYVVDMCYSGKYTKKEMLKKIRGEGGLKSLLGTTDCREIERRIAEGDEYAKLVYEAQALQIAKGIGIMLSCFEEKIDAVILTGGMAYSVMLTDMIKRRIERFVPVEIVAGENEMEALALGALRILRGEESVKEL
nr:butyrate kinase [Sedimentibacter sp.]